MSCGAAVHHCLARLPLQVINAALSKRDVFVLMPTGGGKSRCYQLPAVVGGGVTVVVTPLVSLLTDQMQHLAEAHIPAACFSAGQSLEDQNRIYADLRSDDPGTRVLFVTPEKVVASDRIRDAFANLYSRGQLARVVVDECHCVSQWGHDFRRDYTRLRMFRTEFPQVPIMALTATATPRVSKDIMQQLCMRDPVIFSASFNRPNLRYHVLKKDKNIVSNMAKRLIEQHSDAYSVVQPGIVYCLSRADCEKVAEDLDRELRALLSEAKRAVPRQVRLVDYYHADRTAEERERLQTQWMNGHVLILAATVAFGMGVDNPGVRWVFHHSLPKSLEGYHQESGRAGRDGRDADIVLYFTPADVCKARAMLQSSAAEAGQAGLMQLEHNEATLNAMAAYADNDTICRRVLLLGHFGEHFDRTACNGTCDVCVPGGNGFGEVDVTALAVNVVQAVEELNGRNTENDVHAAVSQIDAEGLNEPTKKASGKNGPSKFAKVFGMRSAINKGSFTFHGWPQSHVVDCLWGTKGKILSLLGHDRMRTFGAVKQSNVLATKDDAGRLVRHLINVGVLRLIAQRMEKKEGKSFANVQQSIAIGPAAADVTARKMKVTFGVKGKQAKAPVLPTAASGVPTKRSRGKCLHAKKAAEQRTAAEDGYELLDNDFNDTPLHGALESSGPDSSPDDFEGDHALATKMRKAPAGKWAAGDATPVPAPGPKSVEKSDKWGIAIMKGLEMLTEWLQARSDLFPSSFMSNFAEMVLTIQVCSSIAKAKPSTDQAVIDCSVDPVRAQWFAPYIIQTVTTANDMASLEVIPDYAWHGAWGKCVEQTKAMKAAVEADIKPIVQPPPSKRARLDALQSSSPAPAGAQLSSKPALGQFRAPEELCKRRSASAAGDK
eukprot:jgi/Ulvmu1/6159/UM028_0015.1